MKKPQKPNYHIFILLGVCGVFIALTLIVIQGRYIIKQNNELPQVNNSVFTSEINKFSIDLEKVSYENIKEDYNEMSIITNLGRIQVGKIGTNFDNVDDYVNNLAQKNSLLIVDKENLLIDDYPSVKSTVTFPVSKSKNEKTYFIYPTEWTVYTLSTDSEALYDDLDQIARSFRYIQ